MKRLALYLLIILIIAAGYLGIASFWNYRVEMAGVMAGQYAPRAVPRTVIPAGTEIRAVLKEGIMESAIPGDRILGFVSSPVRVDNRVVIQSGTPVIGILHQISRKQEEASVSLDFTAILIDRQELPVQIEPVRVTVPIQTDIELLADALNTVSEAGIGAGAGATSQSKEAIAAGLGLGALNGAAAGGEKITDITLILSRPLELRV